MKTAMIALASALFIAPAALASFQEVSDNYKSDAFNAADEDWLRNMENLYSECGEFGNSGYSRIQVLALRYQALGEALDSSNQTAVSEAAQKLSKAIGTNGRFETCWDKVSRMEGLSKKFKRDLKTL
jgi:hypothetical protein